MKRDVFLKLLDFFEQMPTECRRTWIARVKMTPNCPASRGGVSRDGELTALGFGARES